jgi:hypothetical protein
MGCIRPMDNLSHYSLCTLTDAFLESGVNSMLSIYTKI